MQRNIQVLANWRGGSMWQSHCYYNILNELWVEIQLRLQRKEQCKASSCAMSYWIKAELLARPLLLRKWIKICLAKSVKQTSFTILCCFVTSLERHVRNRNYKRNRPILKQIEILRNLRKLIYLHLSLHSSTPLLIWNNFLTIFFFLYFGL